MLIYNTTVKVENSVAEPWLRWMITELGPQMLATQCFTRFHVLRLLDVDDAEGPTYAVQYYTESMTDYQRYLSEFSDDMNRKSQDKWGQSLVFFSTVMEVIQ